MMIFFSCPISFAFCLYLRAFDYIEHTPAFIVGFSFTFLRYLSYRFYS